MTNDSLRQSVLTASREAFELARRAAESGDFAARAEQARQLNDRLTELWPQIESAPTDAQAELTRAWSDARLDLGYVLSHGELDTSTRLYQVIREQTGT